MQHANSPIAQTKLKMNSHAVIIFIFSNKESRYYDVHVNYTNVYMFVHHCVLHYT